MQIRLEISRGINTIDALTKAAFAPMPFSDGSESEIINRLRKDGDVYLSLITIHEGALIAQVVCSRVSIVKTLSNWFGLGPVSVTLSQQKRSIENALIREGMKKIKASGADGCVLIRAKDFYCRLDFKMAAQYDIA